MLALIISYADSEPTDHNLLITVIDYESCIYELVNHVILHMMCNGFKHGSQALVTATSSDDHSYA